MVCIQFPVTYVPKQKAGTHVYRKAPDTLNGMIVIVFPTSAGFFPPGLGDLAGKLVYQWVKFLISMNHHTNAQIILVGVSNRNTIQLPMDRQPWTSMANTLSWSNGSITPPPTRKHQIKVLMIGVCFLLPFLLIYLFSFFKYTQ